MRMLEMCENDQYPHMIQSYTPFWTVITHGYRYLFKSPRR